MARLRAALRRQRGAALLALLTILVLASAAVLLEQLNAEATTGRSAAEDDATAEALAQAKAALIAWSVSHPRRPGVLPFPDRSNDGAYDGYSDCFTGPVTPGLLIGRFPWAGDESPCDVARLYVDVRDADGEPLWYAVSRNVVQYGDGGLLNSDIAELAEHPWITVFDQDGNVLPDPASGGPLRIAAVIIAPGPPLPGQDRTGATPPPSAYLDSVTIPPVTGYTFDNADSDECPDDMACVVAGEQFVMFQNPPSDRDFNDRLIYITVDELMRAVEKRALGEAAQALTRYRDGPAGAYPWLAPFESPRRLSAGSVGSGSSYTLDDTAADFVTDGVQPGDIVVNESDGSYGPVKTVVSPTSLELFGMTGGTENDLDAGETYRVESSFKSVAGTSEGQIPVHLPNEVFYTGFGGRWEITPGTATLSSSSDPLAPPDTDLEQGNINVTAGTGRCMWTTADEATCVGEETMTIVRVILGVPTNITRTVEYSLTLTGPTGMTPTAPGTGDVRRRAVSLHAPDPCMGGSPPAAPCPQHGALPVPVAVSAPSPLLPPPTFSWSIRMTDSDGVGSATRTVTVDAGTTGYLNVTGIRYDLGAVFDDTIATDDEIPEWFVENGWHRLVYARVAAGHAPGAGGACTAGTDCLVLDVGGTVGVRDDIEAMLVGAGSPLDAIFQDRDNGSACTPALPEYLCDYFENVNNQTGDTAARDKRTAAFNDQVRVVWPVPPP